MYNRLFNYRLSLAILLYLSVLPLTACHISGQVTIDGNGLPNVAVHLEGDELALNTTTDKNGRYRFNSVDAGNYLITVDYHQGELHQSQQRVTKLNRQLNVGNVDFMQNSVTKRTINNGSLIGFTEDNGSVAWLGIPYAQAPIGTLRWKAPLPPVDWSGIYPAISTRVSCPQYGDLLSDITPASYGEIIGQEDCLFLNIWAPSYASDADASSPVMFWIHGGGNSIGEGGSYNGKMLAELYGVVVVTINYRLGPLGWFSHPSLHDGQASDRDRSGNYGTLDIIQALHWVQQNITYFGGNPNNVLVFGESAGGADTLTILTSELSEGLFHRAIVQSGGLGWSTVEAAENYIENGGHEFSAKEVINSLLVNEAIATDRNDAIRIQESMGSQAIKDYLYSKTPEEILTVYGGGFAGMLSMPLLIRDGHVLPDSDPLTLFKNGSFHHVPTILGSNRDESKLFMALNPEYSKTVFGLLPIIKDKNYYELSAYYSSKAWKLNGVDDIASAMQTHQSDVYAYRFDWDEEPTLFGIDLSFILGAAHATEIPFVFGNPDEFIVQLLAPFVYNQNNKAGRVFLANSMSSYWAQFAHTGNPGNGFNHSNAVTWQAWNEISTNEKMLLLDTESTTGIRMSTESVTYESLKSEIQNETRFNNIENKCKVYAAHISGIDEFYANNCIHYQ